MQLQMSNSTPITASTVQQLPRCCSTGCSPTSCTLQEAQNHHVQTDSVQQSTDVGTSMLSSTRKPSQRPLLLHQYTAVPVVPSLQMLKLLPQLVDLGQSLLSLVAAVIALHPLHGLHQPVCWPCAAWSQNDGWGSGVAADVGSDTAGACQLCTSMASGQTVQLSRRGSHRPGLVFESTLWSWRGNCAPEAPDFARHTCSGWYPPAPA